MAAGVLHAATPERAEEEQAAKEACNCPKSLVEAKEANTVIFDNELNAFQAFNLAKALDARVMDRTEVILEIFARRARSAEAQIQVELAKTQFLLSRIPVTESQLSVVHPLS